MKKIILLFALFVIFNIFAFGQESDADREEIDYLLFLPNSGNQFADEAKAGIQLDNVARYLKSKNLTNAQIFVYGYTADVPNDIDSSVLSGERALHVIGELQKRGIARNFFKDPVGHGSVNLWGNNINEAGRSPNRRVRILFEDVVITPEVMHVAQETEEPKDTKEEIKEETPVFETAENAQTTQPLSRPIKDDSFNWWWLLLLLLPLLILLWPKRKVKKTKPVSEPRASQTPPASAPKHAGAPSPAQAHASQPAAAPAPEPKTADAPKPFVVDEPVAAPAPVSVPAATPIAAAAAAPVRPEGGEPKYYRLTEEEIRNCAYEIFEERNHAHGYHDEDWLNAISRLFAKYEAEGYIVLWP